MSLMGLDIGTTGCKCTIFSDEGDITAYSYSEYNIENKRAGRFELDAVIVWDSVRNVISRAVKSVNKDPVTAISISSFGESAVPVDKKGQVLANSILYMDDRGASQCRELEDSLGRETIMGLTGVPAHPMYTISKIMWIRDNMPELYERVWKFMLFEDYIAYCLTGIPAIDYSLASRTMAFNVTEKKWEERILNAAGIDGKIFSEAIPSASVIGKVKKNIAEDLGLPYDTVVVTGGHDQVCAALGAGILHEGLAIDGIGTVECITPAFDHPVLSKQMLESNFCCTPHAKDGMYVTYAFNFTGGSILKWYRDNFALYEKNLAGKEGRNVYALLDGKASAKPTRLLVLPHFAGAGTPYMDTGSKGAILGMDFGSTSSDIYRALLEGVTYEMALNMEHLERAGIQIDVLRAVGGGAKSDLWLQIKADIMRKRVQQLDVTEAGTLGTAIMAGTATGVYSSMEQAANQLIKVRKEFYPSPEFEGLYMENYERYKKIYKSIRDIFQ